MWNACEKCRMYVCWRCGSRVVLMCREEYVWMGSLFHGRASEKFDCLRDCVGPYDQVLNVCILCTHCYVFY